MEIMKVKEFFAITQGSRQLRLDENEKPLCGRDFWGKYRNTDKWEAEIDHVRLVSGITEQDGLQYMGVICNIVLK